MQNTPDPPPHPFDVDKEVRFARSEMSSHPISLAYRAGLIGVLLGLVLLPLIYFGLVVAIAYGMYFHFVHDLVFLEDGGFWGFVVYLAPAIVGPALLWFMLRPFFIKRARVALPHEIKPADEPAILEFVERICDLLRAPRPKHIYVDLQPNASASVNGVRGLLRRELNLTIGLPLVGVLSVTQFGGVLAHEFGHFAQGAGMRLSFLIREFNEWIAQIAFQPDIIEQKVADRVGRGGLYGLGIALALRIALWLTRRLLHAVLLLSHAISCYSLRQMEHDADLYGAKVAGTNAFATVSKKLRWVNDGCSRAMQLVQRAAYEGRCPANLVELISARADAARDYDVWRYDESADRLIDGWFDTHPSPAKRIAYVNKFSTTPVVVDDRPAALLFTSFDRLARETTIAFYRETGLAIENFALQELDAFCNGEVLNPGQIVAVNRFLANRAAVERPVSITAADVANANGVETDRLLRDWNLAREQTEDAFISFARSRSRRLQLLRAQALIDARIRFNPRQLGLRARSRTELVDKLRDVAGTSLDAQEKLLVFDAVTRRRLAHALKLSKQNPFSFSHCLALLPAFEKIAPLYAQTYESFVCLGDLLASNRSYRPKTRAHRKMLERSDSLKTDLRLLASRLQLQDPVHPDMTITDRLASRLPSTKLPVSQQIFLEARECLTYLSSTYFQCLARLCTAAAESESSMLPS
jgi:Zn-dependent protease with chaperone function